MQSSVLRLHVVRLSVRSSVTLVDQDHIGWNLEILETNCTDKEPHTFALRSQKIIHLLKPEVVSILGLLSNLLKALTNPVTDSMYTLANRLGGQYF